MSGWGSIGLYEGGGGSSAGDPKDAFIDKIKGTTFKVFCWQNQGPEYYFRFWVDFVW